MISNINHVIHFGHPRDLCAWNGTSGFPTATRDFMMRKTKFLSRIEAL